VATVLLIDDDEDILRLLGEGLRIAGHTVLMGTDGSIGMRLASEHAPDVLVTDIIMPGMEGIETIEVIRREYPGVKVIAMSGGGAVGPRSYLQLARALGADIALKKPFRIADLLESVSSLTGGGGG
jgi:DNA-binding response OmpR family regulator